MKIHRFITPYHIDQDTITITDSEIIHQWKNVLKFKLGENIIITNENLNEVHTVLTSLTKNQAVLNVTKIEKNSNEPKNNVTLYLAILKRENFELVIQKATEIGISNIVPMITQNTVKTGLKYERLEKIAKEASELCGRSTIPTISQAMDFESAINNTKNFKHKILFDVSGEKFIPMLNTEFEIFVGPEGGFTEEEINTAKENDFTIASLGSLTLRGETAGIVASYLAVNL